MFSSCQHRTTYVMPDGLKHVMEVFLELVEEFEFVLNAEFTGLEEALAFEIQTHDLQSDVLD